MVDQRTMDQLRHLGYLDGGFVDEVAAVAAGVGGTCRIEG